jgi:hypothetical protein
MANDLTTFLASLNETRPPAGASLALQALWWDGKGDWDRAHEHAQADPAAAGAWVHAYLHRKEGDLANARYWYSRAGRPPAADSLEAEWRRIAEELLLGPR